MKWILASVAVIALATGTSVAQPGNDKGRGNAAGNEDRGGPPAAVSATNRGNGNSQGQGRGQGQGNQMRGSADPNANGAAIRSERGNAPATQAQRGNRETGNGNAMRASPGNANGNGGNSNAVANRGGPPDRSPAARGNASAGNANRGSGNDRDAIRSVDRGNGRDTLRVSDRRGRGDFRFLRDVNPGLIEGCPPGLARKYNGCRPPGLARQQDAALRRSLSDPRWWGFAGLDRNSYRYDEGYLVRLLDDGRVGSYIPLLGGALTIGRSWPEGYGSSALPDYYTSYYNLGGPDNYRYANDVVYRVAPETAAITSIAALMTGEQFTVGQPMPRGHDIYNIPPGYRDQYYDRPDALYRYNDGYIYQADPATRLVTAAIELLV